MQVLALMDLTVTSSVVVVEAGRVQAGAEAEEEEEEEAWLFGCGGCVRRLALQKFPISFSLAHSIPSTEGISSL